MSSEPPPLGRTGLVVGRVDRLLCALRAAGLRNWQGLIRRRRDRPDGARRCEEARVRQRGCRGCFDEDDSVDQTGQRGDSVLAGW